MTTTIIIIAGLLLLLLWPWRRQDPVFRVVGKRAVAYRTDQAPPFDGHPRVITHRETDEIGEVWIKLEGIPNIMYNLKYFVIYE